MSWKKISHYLIPQEKNNHRATILKPNFLLFLIILYIFSQSLIKTLTIAKPGVLGYSSEITVQKVLNQTNQERQKAGLEPLTFNSLLSQSAQGKAEDMFNNDYWAHNSPQGKTPWTFFDTAGYKYSVAGENLAKDFYNTDSLVKAWMDSPTHKDNILNKKYQEIGIAVVNGTLNGIKTTLVVQHFGTPLNAHPNSVKSTPPTATSTIVETVPINNVLAASNNQKTINPLTLSKIFSLIIFSVLIIVLFIDGFVTVKNNIHRMTGSTIGHIAFLLFILLLILYNHQGSIF